ncbi:MAG: hypothetical protein UR79_C0002G0080 [Candidatus Campbellbacteria bacterium GW2011_GWD1_35_49]|nr:MAG: hypothetical protein UR74_C0002G0253 [Candidatus Campbellbacteria bacterium GW2011_GWD2_35_24]KKP75873.1 MAG: hypothetical protein UR75_C0002G0254 [Candidatus Campbellbacteria bacterium GW2011_GWC2_35_28]KKP76879.1 MAG: hypothetical protein UR76_C0002G0080 [Candidatus Campbellbacteria bacterium GW2011_GWC1_35_31]KKP78805.1 MAG: hypothetical protein UR79_C0002G0080 [Candidatus Campbellbacteria bacterium GW2011_GWD1_35_49]
MSEKKNGKKQPFHEVILGKMREQIEHLPTAQAEADMRKYGTILRESKLPSDKIDEIVIAIALMNQSIPEHYDTKAKNYLKKLTAKITAEIK